MSDSRVLVRSAFLALSALLSSGSVAQSAAALPKVAKVTVNQPVTLTDNGDRWTLDNGIVKLAVAKRDGNISSLVYHGVSIITRGREWEQTRRARSRSATFSGENVAWEKRIDI
jgi:hypothetical protein